MFLLDSEFGSPHLSVRPQEAGVVKESKNFLSALKVISPLQSSQSSHHFTSGRHSGRVTGRLREPG